MVMCNGGDAGFGNGFRYRQPQGNMHGDAQRILHHEKIDAVAFDELVQSGFQKRPEPMDGLGGGWVSNVGSEDLIVDFEVLVVIEVRLENRHAPLGITVGLSGEPIAVVTRLPEYIRPFSGFEGYAVRS
jgi:hypothetical protein